jgi:pimeloyl-ACP methyl ester carboxylesterase
MEGSVRAAIRVAVSSLLAREEAPRVADSCPDRPILLLHGLASNPRVLAPLERHLRGRLRRPTLRLQLGFGLRDVRDSAEIVYEQLERIAEQANFRHADVVAHSLGGLVATYLLKCLDQGRHVRRVVTLGTPHRGVSTARGAVLVMGMISRSMWQLLPDSDFLRRIGRLPVPDGSTLLSIAGGADTVVPAARTQVPAARGQRNAIVRDANHWSLLYEQATLRRVVTALVSDGPFHTTPRARRLPARVARAPLEVPPLTLRVVRPGPLSGNPGPEHVESPALRAALEERRLLATLMERDA